MADALSDFRWPVAADYAIAEEHLPNGKTRVIVFPVGAPNATTQGLFDRVLFREFANVNAASNEAMLTFVRTYGLLGSPLTIEVASPILDGPPVVPANVLGGDWRPGYRLPDAILHMRHAIELWDLIRHKDIEGLQALRRRRYGRSWRKLLYDFQSPLPYVDDVRRSAQEVLRMILNGSLIETAVGPHVTWTQRGDQLQIGHSPRSLCAALWLQFALAVANDRTIKTCHFCEIVFEISKDPTGARTRSDSAFCSDKCKSADYRKRKSTAKTMHTHGRSLRDIAAAISTDAETIRGWITNMAPTTRGQRPTSARSRGAR